MDYLFRESMTLRTSTELEQSCGQTLKVQDESPRRWETRELAGMRKSEDPVRKPFSGVLAPTFLFMELDTEAVTCMRKTHSSQGTSCKPGRLRERL